MLRNLSGRILVSAISAAISIASASAAAQQTSSPPSAPADKADHWKHDEHHGMMPAQLIEARLAYIKTALQITPAQTAQWNAVADVMRKHAKARESEMAQWRAAHDGDQPHTRPDPIAMLEHRQKAMAEASADLAETIAAWKPLYASFSDDQKKIAPEVIGGHGQHEWHHGFGR
jgi:hypothetical protein